MDCMAGISVVQGLHQVAQKFTSTILPRYWLRLWVLPSKSIRLKSSACMPTAGTREPMLHTHGACIMLYVQVASSSPITTTLAVFLIGSPIRSTGFTASGRRFDHLSDLVMPKMELVPSENWLFSSPYRIKRIIPNPYHATRSVDPKEKRDAAPPRAD